MRFFALTITIIFSYVATLNADEQKWPEGSAAANTQGAAQTRDYFERLLSKKYLELIELVSKNGNDGDLVEALRKQEGSWLKYRVDECKLIGYLSGAGGLWPVARQVACEANLTDLRFRTVRHAVRCIERIPSAERAIGQNGCLYQLAPLSMGK